MGTWDSIELWTELSTELGLSTELAIKLATELAPSARIQRRWPDGESASRRIPGEEGLDWDAHAHSSGSIRAIYV